MICNTTDNRVHFSEVKQFARSPAHYRYACENPIREPTRHMLVGSITDALVFGTASVYPIDARRGTLDWKKGEALAIRKAEGRPALICSQNEYDEAMAMAHAVRMDPVANEYLEGCEYQTVIQWESNGIPCATGLHDKRGGVDALHRAKRRVIDLKSTRSSEPEEASRQAIRMHWHAQIAWNIDGCGAAGIPMETGYLLCVESDPPYPVTVLEVVPEMLELGRKEIRLWMERLHSCDAVNEWPGYVQSVVPMVIPRWMEGGEDE